MSTPQEFYCLRYRDEYRNFYPSPAVVAMCCCEHEKENIVKVRFTPDEKGDYWAWEENGNLSMVHPDKALLDLCFPYGTAAAVEAGEGAVVRGTVQEIPET